MIDPGAHYRTGGIEVCANAPLSLLEAIPLKNIKVYPNPSFGNFKIKLNNVLNDKLIVKIVHLLGATVETSSLILSYGEGELECYNLPAGVYVLYLEDPSNAIIYTQKIIIEKR